MKKIKCLCFGICLLLSFFLVNKTHLEVKASAETIITENIEITAENKNEVLTVSNGETITLRGMKFVYAEGVNAKAITLINVKSGGKLIIENVDFTEVYFTTGILNAGEIVINGATFDDSTSDISIVHNNNASGSFKLLHGIISNIYLKQGNILVTQDSRNISGSDGKIKITLDENTIGKRVVVGENILPSYFMNSFEYVGSLNNAVLDYVGDNIVDLVSKDDTITTLGLVPGDIVLTEPYSYIKLGSEVYFANRYCTAVNFIFNASEVVPSGYEFSGLEDFSFCIKNGDYINNYEAYAEANVINYTLVDDVKIYDYKSDTSMITINYIDEASDIISSETKTFDVITGVNHAVFISIPQDYEYVSMSLSSRITEVDGLTKISNSYIRPVIYCTSNGTISVNVKKNICEKDIVFDNYTFVNNSLSVTYANEDFAKLLNPYYEVSGDKNYLEFSITKNGNDVSEIINVGEYTITFEDTETIDFINNVFSVNVTAKEVTLEYTNLNFVYSGNNNVVTASIKTGKIEGDNISVVLENNERINAGRNVITATLTSENYYISEDSLNKEIFVDKYTILASEIVFENNTVDYDSCSHSILATIPDYLKVSYTNNNKVDVGVYYVIANFSFKENVDLNNYNELPFTSLTRVLTINAIDFPLGNVNMVDKVVEYNGEAKSLEFTGELSEEAKMLVGVSYEYYDENDTKLTINPTDAGVYRVVAKFKLLDERNYKPIADKEATLTITKKEIEMSGVEFNSVTVKYDNLPHSIFVLNLPDKVSVSYSSSQNFVNVDEYEVVATFVIKDEYKTNYKLLSSDTSKTAILKIEKGLYDLSAIDFGDETYTYDGTAKSISIDETKLPAGLQVDQYINNGKIDKGEYNVTITFHNLNVNYEDVDAKVVKLIINPRVLSIELDKQMFVYTGNPITVTYSVSNVIEGDDVSVNLAGATNTEANTYTCEVTIVGEDANNYTYDNTNALRYEITKAIVDMSGVSIQNLIERTYDGKEYTPQITGTLPNVLECIYTHVPIRNVGEYTVSIEFRVTNPNYVVPAKREITVRINPKDIAVEFQGWQNLVYDGNPKSLNIIFHGVIEDDFDDYYVEYSSNEVIDVGNYTCYVYLNEYSNYKIVGAYTRDFMIMEDKKVFTSKDISLEITGDTFAPDTEFGVTTGVLDAKTSNLLQAINSNVKFSNQLKIDLETDVALTVSLDAKFLDVNDAEHIKIYKLNGNNLELVDYTLKEGKISFETNGKDVFILVQENESTNSALYWILSILGGICIGSLITIVVVVNKKKNRKAN